VELPYKVISLQHLLTYMIYLANQIMQILILITKSIVNGVWWLKILKATTTIVQFIIGKRERFHMMNMNGILVAGAFMQLHWFKKLSIDKLNPCN
jgi:hypothetical protein